MCRRHCLTTDILVLKRSFFDEKSELHLPVGMRINIYVLLEMITVLGNGSSRALCRAQDLSSLRYLSRHIDSFLPGRIKSNRTSVGYHHDKSATIAPLEVV